MASLVDTNVLVYRYDHRDPSKQERADKLLSGGVDGDALLLPHQAIVEFVSVFMRGGSRRLPALPYDLLASEVEGLMNTFPILYPTPAVLRTALRMAAAYRLAWYDAHLLAYAECFGLNQVYSEDFEHGRSFGYVRVVNPFLV